MPFTTVCPSCGGVLRLLKNYQGRKVMCPDCRKPFLATSIREEELEVAEDGAEVPSKGWLVVCPTCGHTELVADESQRRTHCSRCAGLLPAPRIASKKFRKRPEE